MWHVGVETYDISTGHTFQMKVALMCTINDSPAYGMLFRWSTNGELAMSSIHETAKGFEIEK